MLGLALPALLSVSAAGCGKGSGHPARGSVPATSATSAVSASSASAAHDTELCARIVAHWSRAVLDSGTYGDYQSMGLSNGQYEILRDVVDAARAVKRRQGAAAADKLIDRRARRACAERYRHGAPSGGPWR